MIFAIDFDGTIVEHQYPQIGNLVPGAIDVIKALIKNGHFVYLWTMRDGVELDNAVKYLQDRGILLNGVNRAFNPWSESPKLYANYYIDDAALGTPLVEPLGKRPYVDWFEIEKLLIKKSII